MSPTGQSTNSSHTEMTSIEFAAAVGSEPKDDDMDRVNCRVAGTIGHSQCGWCWDCNKPRFMCGHSHVPDEEKTP